MAWRPGQTPTKPNDPLCVSRETGSSCYRSLQFRRSDIRRVNKQNFKGVAVDDTRTSRLESHCEVLVGICGQQGAENIHFPAILLSGKNTAGLVSSSGKNNHTNLGCRGGRTSRIDSNTCFIFIRWFGVLPAPGAQSVTDLDPVDSNSRTPDGRLLLAINWLLQHQVTLIVLSQHNSLVFPISLDNVCSSFCSGCKCIITFYVWKSTGSLLVVSTEL